MSKQIETNVEDSNKSDAISFTGLREFCSLGSVLDIVVRIILIKGK